MTRERDRCTAEWQKFMGTHYEADPDIRCQLRKKHSGAHRYVDKANDFSASWANYPTVEDQAQAAWEAYRDKRVAEQVEQYRANRHDRADWRYDDHGAARRSMRKREFIAGYLAARSRS